MISPFAAGAEVLTLVVKVSQGNPTSGVAYLYHDDPLGSDDGERLNPDDPCVLAALPVQSVCQVNFSVGDAVLTALDSLSVFIKTDGGNFEGASACVLIDPDGVAP